MSVNIDWNNLGFDYMQLPYRYVAHWKDGAWDEGKLSTDPNLTMNEGSPILHYGQGAFEGMKAYRPNQEKSNFSGLTKMPIDCTTLLTNY